MHYMMLIAALLPALLLGLYIWRKDPHPEPASWILRAFFGGVLICIPVAFAEYGLQQVLFPTGHPTTLFGTTVQAFLVAALPEEAAKLFILWCILYRNPHFDEHFDGIVYAVFVSLGFAAVENVSYVINAGEGWVTVAAMRALLSVPGHYAFGIVMGYCYSVYIFFKHTPARGAMVLLMPVMAHGVYDALAMSGTVDPLAGGISFFVLIYFCIKLQKAAHKRIEAMIK
ncbi:MAG: PrsW family intramembrane metalloprotease [Paludibacteraceae bacterium]|nr:PrsW family intramembrane metalloprotease [Paludibacteraceae bacterium]